MYELETLLQSYKIAIVLKGLYKDKSGAAYKHYEQKENEIYQEIINLFKESRKN